MRVLAAGHGCSAVRRRDRHAVDVDVHAAAVIAAIEVDGRLSRRRPVEVRVGYVAQRHRPLQQIKTPRRRTNI